MKTKPKGGHFRGGGAGRTHPADQALSAIARAQQEVYDKARQDVEVTLFEYIFLGKRPPKITGGGGDFRGGGAGRIRVGYDTQRGKDIKKLVRGLKWLATRAYIAQTLYRANKAALDIANTYAPKVVADSATSTAYTFRNVYDALPYTEQAVLALAKDHLLTVPTRTVDKGKDTAWIQQILQSIADRYALSDLPPDQLPAAIARTVTQRCQRSMDATTQALIYGAFDYGMYRAGLDAAKLGVPVEKTWLSIMDNYVRDSHRHLHKTTIPIKRRFRGLYGTLRFPHDPTAPAPEIMNCRCRMAVHLKGRASDAPDSLTRAQVASYRRWRDKVIDSLGGELALETALWRRYNG